jgi:hypothetical protein
MLNVYPRGDRDSSEYVSCYLKRILGDNDEAVTAKFSTRCRDICHSGGIQVFDYTNASWDFRNYCERKKVIERNPDEDGTLVIEVDIQIAVDKDVWYHLRNV